MRQLRLTTTALAALTLAAGAADATTFDIRSATGLFAPTFRGDAGATWVGWDLFDDNGAGDMIINDQTPDIGTDGGSFVTTNGEDHISGSLNYYSGFGAVAEDVTFEVDGVDGSGFTTIIVQAKTLFGGFGEEAIGFSPIEGVLPTVVSTVDRPAVGANAIGQGQLFAKYEIPTGLSGTQTLSISGGIQTSIDQFVVDTFWSADGFAADGAVMTPEPTAAVLAALALAGATASRRR